MSWGQGQKLNNDRYEILQRIGTGGFGVTYKAIDTNATPNKIVAIKTLNEKRQRQTNFEQLQENFLNEVMSLAKCSHPYVIRVERVFNEGSLWAMVMEYVEGESLDEWIEEKGSLEEAWAVEIVRKIGEAVSYVHDRGILHRDIKPMNILIRSNGEPILIDFGLARDLVAGIARTMKIERTPHYSPPEQRELTPAVDVYALAATLYSCVTGELPARADLRVLRENLVPPQELNPQVSDRVNEAILQGMALRVENRSATILEWLELLPVSESNGLKKFIFGTATIKIGGILSNKLSIIRQMSQAEHLTEDLGGGVKLEMVSIPAGSFLMGSPQCEEGVFANEMPQHLVKIPGFYMGKYPVTQDQYLAIMGKNPAYFPGGDLPVEQVSWENAQQFCAQLSVISGKTYRLPSEAEWEYACRSGTTTPFHFGATIDAQIANYRAQDWELSGATYPGNYGKGELGVFREKTIPVGSLGVANGFGLYDMHGNVWEWCEDVWHHNYERAPTDGSAWRNSEDVDSFACTFGDRLLRGGSWNYGPWNCRSAFRYGRAAVYKDMIIGFRVVISQDS